MNLPQITAQAINQELAEIQLAISADLQAFEGHFESAPIIPGVEQLRWVVEFAQKCFELDDIEVERVDALKFQNVIQPNSEITLNLVNKNNRIDFSFTTGELRHSSGKVLIK
jgi:3-hydroxymyristoyl/3-hydroxydecanoyl-(acyl carrier protein) dehydratase